MYHLYSVFAFGALAVTCSGALAQAPSADVANYPERMVRLIVPFSAGSMTDIIARSIADKLTTNWNQQVIVENRPGWLAPPASPSHRQMATR
jgi:tripartite-type tricarboxylate transporter receptor subunit TctC